MVIAHACRSTTVEHIFCRAFERNANMAYEFKESDWKLFHKRLPDWQEAFMDRLNREYIRILTADGTPSDRFWKLEEKILEDKKYTGVQCNPRRSNFVLLIRQLLTESAITLEDIDGFSDELQEHLRNWVRRSYEDDE